MEHVIVGQSEGQDVDSKHIRTHNNYQIIKDSLSIFNFVMDMCSMEFLRDF
jgi:hypothetical protein